jgi:hypothetical protein
MTLHTRLHGIDVDRLVGHVARIIFSHAGTGVKLIKPCKRRKVELVARLPMKFRNAHVALKEMLGLG